VVRREAFGSRVQSRASLIMYLWRLRCQTSAYRHSFNFKQFPVYRRTQPSHLSEGRQRTRLLIAVSISVSSPTLRVFITTTVFKEICIALKRMPSLPDVMLVPRRVRHVLRPHHQIDTLSGKVGVCAGPTNLKVDD
jgi:hypothetical protein